MGGLTALRIVLVLILIIFLDPDRSPGARKRTRTSKRTIRAGPGGPTLDETGPCRELAPGWQQRDPIGRCALRPRNHSRRSFEQFPSRTNWTAMRLASCLPPGANSERWRSLNSHRGPTGPRCSQKNTHRRPSRSTRRRPRSGLGGRGIWCGRWLIGLGSAVKPRGNFLANRQLRPGVRKWLHWFGKNKKPTPGREVGS
jgi:hypothetical protein